MFLNNAYDTTMCTILWGSFEPKGETEVSCSKNSLMSSLWRFPAQWKRRKKQLSKLLTSQVYNTLLLYSCVYFRRTHKHMLNEEVRILLGVWARQHNCSVRMTPQSQRIIVLLFTSPCALWSPLMNMFALCRKEPLTLFNKKIQTTRPDE